MTIAVKIQKFEGGLWKFHLPIPTQIALSFTSGAHKRIKCKLNRAYSWQTAFMKNADYWFILVNQEIMDKCSLELHQEVTLEIEKDNSTFGMEVAKEFEELLLQDVIANQYFLELAPGKQRNLIYIINKVKSTDSRLKKSLAIAFHLKETKGRIDFKLLNQTIKRFNNQNF